ncbi:CocE/NonD family hydrolase [Pelagicoccus sp. SDUM812002]|uniref:CocE/NonD family hydrolase n=1 Tax=Pelagicoccus sp. SDUM812002 TaxID=3041266 RepID=UPI00280F51FE|nr:CocE/NonD family hydrolase [Pelagicoccus sp. SDUM812002]MDQ8185816.1 CocE/NonD family hydrolase [Pelagicoccus sp. SDUM812002]
MSNHRIVPTIKPALAIGLMALVSSSTLVGQVMFPRDQIAVVHGVTEGAPVTEDISGQQTYQSADWRARMSEQFPAADADGDGTVSEAEAIQFHLSQVRQFTPQGRELELLPEGTSRWTERVEMRDGETLPTEIYLPAGDGPWPVVLVRTSRGRIDSALDYGNELLRHGYAFVGQDLTPEGDFVNADVLGREVEGSEMSREARAAFNARRSARNAGEDGADAIAWIAKQSWCDGNIAVNGYSEGAAQSKGAMSENPPELDLVVTAIGSLSRGSRSAIGAPSGGRVSWNGDISEPEDSWEPTPDSSRWGRPGDELVRNASDLDIQYNDRTGWFDGGNTQGAINEWVALKDHGKATLIMGIGGHGALSTEGRVPPAYGDCDLLFPEIDVFQMLRGESEPKQSHLFYFLMGDATNPNAPGNLWKATETWPVPHAEQSWYFRSDGTLSTGSPTKEKGSNAYTYDPADPIHVLSGARSARHSGPRDHSVLSEREDILRYDSEPLSEALEITGEAHVDLYFSSDAPDTMYVVTVVDIYPDGYEWPIRDTALTARYRDGLDKPTKLKKGEVYHAKIPLVSTAIVLDRGHRLGVRISSSSYPAYVIHPNTWEAIDSYEKARVAQQRIHTGGKHASRLVLPVVKPGAVADYDPQVEY